MKSLLGGLRKQRGKGFDRYPAFVLGDIEEVGDKTYRARFSFRPAGDMFGAPPPVELFVAANLVSEAAARSVITEEVIEAQREFPLTRFFLILESDDDHFVPMALFDPGSTTWENVLPTRWNCPSCGRARTYTRIHGVLPPMCCGSRLEQAGVELGFEVLPREEAADASADFEEVRRKLADAFEGAGLRSGRSTVH
ncbi:MAG TPA: hypothetical protein VFN64_15065 [Burkholderiaceae bacterium]|nr:hypothetical protein [Burkholderiaceae bacterium]